MEEASKEFMECAREPVKGRYYTILSRVKIDPFFVRTIGQLVCLGLSTLLYTNKIYQPEARICLYRTGFKAACVQVVVRFFTLADGCVQRVADLLRENKYIYAVTLKVWFTLKSLLPLLNVCRVTL